MSSKTTCSVQKGSFRGWEAFYLENEFIRLVAVPAIGGRIMALDLGDYPFFYVDRDLAGKLYSAKENQGDCSLAALKNYGGYKTWPAPQGWDNDQQWHGPPDPVLDTGQYTVDLYASDASRAVIRMVSPPDQRTGVQITRQFVLTKGSSRVQVNLSFTNVKDEPIRWSIWDVVQLRAELQKPDGTFTHDPNCIVTTPLKENGRFPQGYNVMFGDENNPQWQIDTEKGLFKAPYLWQIGKVGLDSQAGWIAFHNGTEDVAFTEQFKVKPNAEYPDDGATVECWTVGAGQVANLDFTGSDIYLMETEVLGPIQEIAPGQSTSFAMEWGVAHCAGPVVDVQAGGCSAVRLKTAVTDQSVHLTGQFGIFDTGELICNWKNAAGEVIAKETIGEVNPLTPVNLNEICEIPAGAAAVELAVVADADGVERGLETAVLPAKSAEA
ncbi:MAG: DUF4380 domain-containing protein [Chloroflexi bacterium]|nr:MAG: DUF4380 domain-containing protein [Chloroflexota bacterium]